MITKMILSNGQYGEKMNFKELIKHSNQATIVFNSRIGVERESQRISQDGRLAQTDHPKSLGSRLYHPYVQTDFAESQMEMITPVCGSIDELFDWLAAIHRVVLQSLPDDELLWPLSMPPALPKLDGDIPLAKLDKFEDVLYRRYLSQVYGRKKQMVSGIHFNYELPESLMQSVFNQQNEFSDFNLFKTNVYMKISRNYLHYRFMITYLFGASPYAFANYFSQSDQVPREPIRSIRNSRLGYVNKEDISVSFQSLDNYLSDLHKLVHEGKLIEEKEFYSAVRLRAGNQVSDLDDHGIDYLELRNIDVNPFDEYGVNKREIKFLELFMLFMLWTDETPDYNLEMNEGNVFNETVAKENPNEQTKLFVQAMHLITDIRTMTNELNIDGAADVVDWAESLIKNPALTLASKMVDSSATDTLQFAIRTAQSNKVDTLSVPYQLNGFENMELSTQQLIFDAIQKGVTVSIIDKNDQLIGLEFNGNKRYVKNGSMTDLDSYVVPLIMKNKLATKRILSNAGFNVPAGVELMNLSDAKSYFSQISSAIVVKPKSMNYGLGVSVFHHQPTKDEFLTAVSRALKAGDSVLVEELIEGTEYRFFVINHEVKAVLKRMPANVTGDGSHTIAELVQRKNASLMRGVVDRAPLTKINMGTLERKSLASQNLSWSSILNVGQTVYLRENSNISTGGDSIDCTDEMADYYKQYALNAVETLGAIVCGIDLVIPDINDTQRATIIEANFNPAMHMHMYPYQGKSHRLTLDVLKMLFPTLKV